MNRDSCLTISMLSEISRKRLAEKINMNKDLRLRDHISQYLPGTYERSYVFPLKYCGEYLTRSGSMFSMCGLPPVVHVVCGEFRGLPPVVAVFAMFCHVVQASLMIRLHRSSVLCHEQFDLKISPNRKSTRKYNCSCIRIYCKWDPVHMNWRGLFGVILIRAKPKNF